MPLLPSANTCCNPCEDSSTVQVTLSELISAQGCQSYGDGPPTALADIGCTYWDDLNKQWYIRETDTGTGLAAWRLMLS